MKCLKFLLPVSLLLLLTGCLEIQEDIQIKKDGSGQLVMKMDMSKLLDVMQNYLGKDEMDKQVPKKPIDTVILMKDLVDTSTSMTAERKALVRNGWLHMKLNMDEKVFKTDLNFPFTNLANLQKLYTALSDGSLGTDKMFKGLAGANGQEGADAGGSNGSPDISQFNGIYDMQVRDGFISKKLNADKWKALQGSQQVAQMKEVSAMGMELPYTLTISLPRPVKKVDNALAQISEDKKTVTIKFNLTEVFENPEKFEYSIAY